MSAFFSWGGQRELKEINEKLKSEIDTLKKANDKLKSEIDTLKKEYDALKKKMKNGARH